MIEIVCGDVNVGKTTWLQQDFLQSPDADGFVCQKVFEAGQHIGYDLKRLRNRQMCPFIRKPDHLPENWNEAFRLGVHYSFSTDGFAFAQQITDEAISNHAKCFYLDEIAHLELKKKGFYNIVNQLLAVPNMDLVLVIRRSLVEQAAELFGIKDYTLIDMLTPEAKTADR